MKHSSVVKRTKYCALSYLMIIITICNIELYMLYVFEIKIYKQLLPLLSVIPQLCPLSI